MAEKKGMIVSEVASILGIAEYLVSLLFSAGDLKKHSDGSYTIPSVDSLEGSFRLRELQGVSDRYTFVNTKNVKTIQPYGDASVDWVEDQIRAGDIGGKYVEGIGWFVDNESWDPQAIGEQYENRNVKVAEDLPDFTTFDRANFSEANLKQWARETGADIGDVAVFDKDDNIVGAMPDIVSEVQAWMVAEDPAKPPDEFMSLGEATKQFEELTLTDYTTDDWNKIFAQGLVPSEIIDGLRQVPASFFSDISSDIGSIKEPIDEYLLSLQATVAPGKTFDQDALTESQVRNYIAGEGLEPAEVMRFNQAGAAVGLLPGVDAKAIREWKPGKAPEAEVPEHVTAAKAGVTIARGQTFADETFRSPEDVFVFDEKDSILGFQPGVMEDLLNWERAVPEAAAVPEHVTVDRAGISIAKGQTFIDETGASAEDVFVFSEADKILGFQPGIVDQLNAWDLAEAPEEARDFTSFDQALFNEPQLKAYAIGTDTPITDIAVFSESGNIVGVKPGADLKTIRDWKPPEKVEPERDYWTYDEKGMTKTTLRNLINAGELEGKFSDTGTLIGATKESYAGYETGLEAARTEAQRVQDEAILGFDIFSQIGTGERIVDIGEVSGWIPELDTPEKVIAFWGAGEDGQYVVADLMSRLSGKQAALSGVADTGEYVSDTDRPIGDGSGGTVPMDGAPGGVGTRGTDGQVEITTQPIVATDPEIRISGAPDLGTKGTAEQRADLLLRAASGLVDIFTKADPTTRVSYDPSSFDAMRELQKGSTITPIDSDMFPRIDPANLPPAPVKADPVAVAVKVSSDKIVSDRTPATDMVEIGGEQLSTVRTGRSVVTPGSDIKGGLGLDLGPLMMEGFRQQLGIGDTGIAPVSGVTRTAQPGLGVPEGVAGPEQLAAIEAYNVRTAGARKYEALRQADIARGAAEWEETKKTYYRRRR